MDPPRPYRLGSRSLTVVAAGMLAISRVRFASLLKSVSIDRNRYGFQKSLLPFENFLAFALLQFIINSAQM